MRGSATGSAAYCAILSRRSHTRILPFSVMKLSTSPPVSLTVSKPVIHNRWIMPSCFQSIGGPSQYSRLFCKSASTQHKLNESQYDANSSSSALSQDTPVVASDSSLSTTRHGMVENAVSSSRGRNAVSLLPVYLGDARAVTKYHPLHAPDGALQLSVAENQMLEDLLVPAIQEFSSSTLEGNKSSAVGAGFFQSDQIYYQSTHGRLGLRQAMAKYLERILKLSREGKTLDVDGIVMGAGCNAVLENLCFCLTEPGDAVLLPTPYYAAFEFDLVARAGLNIVPVSSMKFAMKESFRHDGRYGDDDDDEEDVLYHGRIGTDKSHYYPNRASLDAAYHAALANGSQPKILLLSHPNNPLGICYPPSVVLECIQWAREKQVHLVSDEIYAGSVYQSINPDTGEETFSSALALASKCKSHTNTNSKGHDGCRDHVGLGLGPYIHFVYALSKDFALSGLRVGVAYSENEEIRIPMQKLNDLCQISSQTQVTVEEMLSAPTPTTTTTTTSSSEDEMGGGVGSGFWSTDFFLPENHKRIQRRSQSLQTLLEECEIPFLRGDSGLFLWMDLSEFLPQLPEEGQASGMDESPESMDARERALYLELMNEYGLLFTPGRSMRNELPGFFRCVFTAASEAEFELGLDRIQSFVAAKRK